MNASEIVSKIRDNLPSDTLMYQQPNKEDQIKAVQTILDRGIEVHIVNEPIIKNKGKIFSLYSYLLNGPMTVPPNVSKVFIWCWYALPDGKEVIRIAHDHQEEKIDYENHLLNLLAVTHRDGGHYTEKHGLNKSIEDAMKIVSNLVVRGD